MFLDYQPNRALINDSNNELINVYKVVRDYPSELIDELTIHDKRNKKNGSEWFYQIRSLDRTTEYEALSDVERAARIIYLNKTCYNGLFRVNAAGQLNTPYGRYKNPNIINADGIWALHEYLTTAQVTITCGDYAESLKALPSGAFVYLDPPYMPISATSAFTGYTASGFDYAAQERLRDQCVTLANQGIKFVQSNSDSPLIRDLYKDFTIDTVEAKRSINTKSDKRGPVKEVLIHA